MTKNEQKNRKKGFYWSLFINGIFVALLVVPFYYLLEGKPILPEREFIEVAAILGDNGGQKASKKSNPSKKNVKPNPLEDPKPQPKPEPSPDPIEDPKPQPDPNNTIINNNDNAEDDNKIVDNNENNQDDDDIINPNNNNNNNVIINNGNKGDKHKEDPYKGPKGGGKVKVCEPVSSSQYSNWVSRISSRPFETDKLRNAQLLLRDACFSVDQIKGIANIFTFEQSKLTFLKEAYNHCSTPDDYYQVAEVLTFQQSINQIEDLMFK